MYKGIPFEERIAYPGTPEMMAVNPVGKVPAMTTEQGTNLSESSVLVDYLEDVYPDTPLYPQDADAPSEMGCAAIRQGKLLTRAGQFLDGSKQYVMHFGKDELPPILEQYRPGIQTAG